MQTIANALAAIASTTTAQAAVTVDLDLAALRNDPATACGAAAYPLPQAGSKPASPLILPLGLGLPATAVAAALGLGAMLRAGRG